MKILHVISGIEPTNGGPSVALRGLTKAQKSAGLDVQVVSTAHEKTDQAVLETTRAAFEADGVPVTLVGPAVGKLGKHPDLLPTLDRLVPTVDVVHIHAIFEEIQHLAGVASRRHGKPHLYRACGMLDPWSLSQSKWMKKLYFAWRLSRDLRGASAIHAVTPVEKQNIDRLNLGSPTLMELNGIDLTEFDPLPEGGFLRERIPEAQDRPIVLFLSRLHPKKGLDLLIPAVRRAIDAMPDRPPYLALVGPIASGYEPTVQGLLDQSDMSGHASLVGMLHGSERVNAFVDADVYALPSYQENFGIAVAEAMAAGVPTLASTEVALSPMMAEADVGVVCTTELPDVAEKLIALLQDESRREHLAHAGRAWAMQQFDWNAIAVRWTAHYAKLVEAARRGEKYDG